MPEKKKQHYVPQFYLRNFSSDPSRKFINIFNLTRKKIIQNGSLRDQCYENYFYGDDLVAENMFGIIEREASVIISGIIERKIIPKRFSVEHSTLLTFVLMQHARTKHKADSINQQAGEFAKLILSKNKELSDVLDKVSINLTQPTELPLSVTIEGLPLTYDLKFKIIQNSTEKDFVVSDNPVILRNQFARERKAFNNIGLACSGLQIFCPISSKYMIIFYDEEVYKIGSKNSCLVNISQPADIEKLNELQFLNADENIYFSSIAQRSNIFSTYFSTVQHYSKLRPIIGEGPKQEVAPGKFRVLVKMHTPEQNKKLEITFIKTYRRITTEELNHCGPLVRDVELVYALQEFQRLVKSGIYQYGQFQDFIQSKKIDFKIRGIFTDTF